MFKKDYPLLDKINKIIGENRLLIELIHKKYIQHHDDSKCVKSRGPKALSE